MMKIIDESTTLKELALIVGGRLKECKINAVLTGGAVVSIYTSNHYQSYDLDFISHDSDHEIASALKAIGFEKRGRYYINPCTSFYIEFPSPPLAIGNKPIFTFNEIKTDFGYLKLLTPTQCVMDRLAAYYHWNDQQTLSQAIMVATSNPIDLMEIKKWSEEEGSMEKYREFVGRLSNQ